MSAVVLHRCRTPTNWLCPCGRVARELRRRGIEPEVRRVPWRRHSRGEVDGITGQDRVPVLEIGADVICDSKRIVEHLVWRDERQRAALVERDEPPRRMVGRGDGRRGDDRR
jgi:glutathione S-transferase